MMFNQLRNPHFYLVWGLDILVFAAAFWGAYLLRFDFYPGKYYLSQFLAILPWLLLIKSGCFLVSGVYRGLWRYTGITDLLRLLGATIFASALIVAGIAFLTNFAGYSRGVFVLDALLTFILACSFRVGIRIGLNRFPPGSLTRTALNAKKITPPQKIIIVGAGDAGEKTLRELQDNPRLAYRVVGFLDDDRTRTGRTIHGIPILGTVAQLPDLATRKGIEGIFIAAPSTTGSQMRAIVEICKKAGIPYKTLPGLGELIDGKVSVKALRDVRFEDLLGRPAVRLNPEQITGYLTNRVVLVTGAGGSIGRELCRQIIRFNPSTLVLLDASEPGLYTVQMELKHLKGYLKYRVVLGSVCDSHLMDSLFQHYQPAVVFHAAAYKHVPMLERNPWQAVINNVIGARTLLEQATRHGCERVVMISTDKAVRPTNVMGASKRVCERLMFAWMEGPTRLMAVRFGNVVGSAGSVVPLFREQIERGGPVTVTHPEVTRFFMTIPEACQLVLQAGALGQGGEIFVLEMGTPVKIIDMARDLIRLSGREPDQDIEIVFTGLRPGEKLHEELITSGEDVAKTEHDKIMVLKTADCYNGCMNQESYRRWIYEALQELEKQAARYDAAAIKEAFRRIVPEYEQQAQKTVFQGE